MPTTTSRPLFEQFDSWLKDIDNAKTASVKPKQNVKKAGPSGLGKSTHPSDDVDNNTHPEETGERFAENSEDVKKDVPGQSVDETEPGSGGSQDDKQYNIGTTQSAVGEDPSVEDAYKGDKDDPGTSSPASTEIGEKYSSMRLPELIKLAENRANDLLVDLSKDILVSDKPQTIQQKAATINKAVTTQTPKTTQAVEDGYKAAANAGDADLEKMAADFVAQTIHDANLDADLTGAFVHSYYKSRTKTSADGDGSGEGEMHKEEEPPAAEGPPTEGGSGSGDIMSALGGAGAGGGAAPMPPADPAAGAGAPPGAGGGMNQEQALQELAMALQELGISPEELAQMAQQGPGAGAMGGAGGGMPPPEAAMGGAEGGMPPTGAMPPPGAAEGAKLASAVKNYKLAGKFKFSEAKTATQRQARDQIKDYVRELIGANR